MHTTGEWALGRRGLQGNIAHVAGVSGTQRLVATTFRLFDREGVRPGLLKRFRIKT